MALPAAQSLPLLAWSKLVNDAVTEPYLDEVFHVRQAQNYCQNRFDVWDPKITTPPGLYLLSYIVSPVVGCDIFWLRSLNVFCLVALQAVVTWTYPLRKPGGYDHWASQHSALNVTLFPPLFFFAALYYTDVPSTLSVLIFYWLFLHFSGPRKFSPLRTPALVLSGISSLFFRQTNIFWVAIFPAGLVLVNELDRAHDAVKNSMYRREEGFGDTWTSIVRTSWKMSAVYDPAVRNASISGTNLPSLQALQYSNTQPDYGKTAISIATLCLKLPTHPTRLAHTLQALLPYIITTLTFTILIHFNGSVVLGDKSNHTATLHLPQLLYLWPYLTFFSWPLLYPYLLTIPFGLFAQLPAVATLEAMLMFKRRRLGPQYWLLGICVGVACAVVHFNTIVHPFTLADNRHYTFYVFRRLMNPWWVKFAVTPVYVLCAWACMQAMGARPLDVSVYKDPAGKKNEDKSSQQSEDRHKPPTLPDGSSGATTSFVLIWLATTTLQLVTAPLVEPRYLILPWIFWRIHVPLQNGSAQLARTDLTFRERLKTVDHRLLLETVWLLLINAGTGYMFLYQGFEWPQEPGRVQRFMW
ncbi:glucosyltransferase [Saxophila tyrrhenica]|uniref:Dol-P-Glc:Glc(2)Man(9)GlcNAc(2)-PP-Dol alpha-1,2-glucosyltransferase n=1 Tax=Saxophila tyrrhenica TaxID=1690608 RepID=A0AAV9PFF0_9PEZI|nr:glucosyltransferase [Saxophila tyrrhenica]